MKFDAEVKREIKKMAIGCLVCTLLVLAVFLAIGKLDYTVLIGGALGYIASFGNFYLMSAGVVRALEMGDEVSAKLKLRSSYITRTVLLVGVIAISIAVDFINFIPPLLSVFYPRITISACNLYNTYVKKKDAADELSYTASAEISEDEGSDEFEKFVSGFYKGDSITTKQGEDKSEK